MTQSFHLPDLGEGIAEGEIISWRVDVGDTVVEEQPLVEIETDKALVEIPSPFEGRVREIHAEAGEIVTVGAALLDIETDAIEDESPAPTATETDARGSFARPSTRRLARELGVDLDAIGGSGAGGRITDEDVHEAHEQANDVDTEAPETVEESKPGERARSRVLATPAVRRVAAELGVDLDAVSPSVDRDGEPVVTMADVERATETGPRQRVPYRGVRRTIGERLESAWQTIPHATHYDDVDATALVALREQLKPEAAEREVRLTFLPFVMCAVTRALAAHPVLNASLDDDTDEIIHHDRYHIGFATDTDAGLLVPVVRDADQKDIFDLAAKIEALVEAAKDRSIELDALQGGTFTITNIGGIGGRYATPIVNPPQVAILATGAIAERPWVVDGEVVVRPILPLSLSFDHRVVDGADAARFVNELKDYVSSPARLLVT